MTKWERRILKSLPVAFLLFAFIISAWVYDIQANNANDARKNAETIAKLVADRTVRMARFDSAMVKTVALNTWYEKYLTLHYSLDSLEYARNRKPQEGR